MNQSNLNLTVEEKRLYSQLFQQADREGLGVVTGDVAVKAFERTGLDGVALGEIWQIADAENRGLLTPAGFSIALRLIGHCQAGKEPSAELSKSPGPLPRFDGGITSSQPSVPSSPSTALHPQLSGGPIRVPPLFPDKVNEYSAMFERAGARNGLLAGDAAKQMFERARLPNEVLGRIWNLVDREQRGTLNVVEFVVAMHLLASMKSGALRALPSNLPPGLYEAASRKGAPPPASQGSISRQLTGPPLQRTQSPLARTAVGSPPPPLSIQSTGSDWLITPLDKAKFDQIFTTVDRAGRGFITGDQAVQFFSTSGLSEDTLASIWDLADVNSEGQLSRDEFAVAMYLIRQQRSKDNTVNILPTTLPPNLVPPSLRRAAVQSQQPRVPTFNDGGFATPQTKSASDDLFGLDALSADEGSVQPPNVERPSHLLGNKNNGASPQTSLGAWPPSAPVDLARGPSFKPFAPMSSFGQGLAQQQNGGSTQSDSTGGTMRFQHPVNDDLLGDSDPGISHKLNEETTELASMSNQIGNLRNQIQDVQNRKTTTETELASSSAQKHELEERLSQFRSQYEQEVKEVTSLEERLKTSRTDTQRLQQELAMIQGAHQDLQHQKQQVTAALAADQHENLTLKNRIRDVNAEILQLKPLLEKAKSEARQQKGMIAINKKQLSTSEGEKDKLKTEVTGLEKSNAERATIDRAAQDAPSSPVNASNIMMTGQSMNPFLRKSSPPSVDRSNLPPLFMPTPSSTPAQTTFDSIFGPSGPAPQASQPPPTTFQTAPQSENRRSTPFDSPNIHTPSTSSSPTTSQGMGRGSEAPLPPPASLQLTSSAIPSQSREHSESASSSVKAVAPAFHSEFSSMSSPTQPLTSPPISLDRDRSFSREHGRSFPIESGGNMSEYPSVGRHQTPFTTANVAEDSTRSGEPPRILSVPSGEHETTTSQSNMVANPFPEATFASVRSTPTGGSTASYISTTNNHNPEHTTSNQASAPMAVVNPVRAPHSARSDLSSSATSSGEYHQAEEHADPASQVGNYGSTSSSEPRTTKPQPEFPPIQDLNHDEDSDSDDGVHGFHNNFTTRGQSLASDKTIQDSAGVPARSDESSQNLLVSEPTMTRAETDSSQSPSNGQAFHPTIGTNNAFSTAVQRSQEPSQVSQGFRDLLPSREISHPPSQSPQQLLPDERSSFQPESFQFPASNEQSDAATQASQNQQSNLPNFLTAQTVSPLTTSEQSLGQDSSTGAFLGQSSYKGQPVHAGPSTVLESRPPADEFDAIFDDLKEADVVDVQNGDGVALHIRQRDEYEFNPVFDSPPNSKTTLGDSQHNTPSTAFKSMNNPTVSDTDFDSLGASPQFVGTSRAPPRSVSGPHDWDSIFAGLDKPGDVDKANGSGSPFAFDTESHVSSNPTIAPVTQRRPVQLGRALTAGTEHDDPILKSLTGMGYARDDALRALEKYDYNLDKAADYLTSKH